MHLRRQALLHRLDLQRRHPRVDQQRVAVGHDVEDRHARRHNPARRAVAQPQHGAGQRVPGRGQALGDQRQLRLDGGDLLGHLPQMLGVHGDGLQLRLAECRRTPPATAGERPCMTVPGPDNHQSGRYSRLMLDDPPPPGRTAAKTWVGSRTDSPEPGAPAPARTAHPLSSPFRCQPHANSLQPIRSVATLQGTQSCLGLQPKPSVANRPIAKKARFQCF